MTPGLKCECPNCCATTHVCPAAETLEAEVAQRLTAERARDEARALLREVRPIIHAAEVLKPSGCTLLARLDAVLGGRDA